MSFRQKIHIEEDIPERLELAWDFRPSDGGVRNQNYVVLSIVAPEGTNQRTPSTFGIKIYGCFGTQEAANDYAKKLQRECDVFDYYVMNTLEWVKLPPQVEKLEDVNFMEEELERLKKNTLDMRVTRAQLLKDRLIQERKAEKEKKQLLEQEAEDVTTTAESKLKND